MRLYHSPDDLTADRGHLAGDIVLSDLRIENFRGLQRLEFSDLTRVNVLVGANNAGKTAGLEAIELLGRGANTQAVLDILQRRDEFAVSSLSETRRAFTGRGGPFHYEFRGLFFGRDPHVGSSFSIAGTDGGTTTYSCTLQPLQMNQSLLFEDSSEENGLASPPLSLGIEVGAEKAELPLVDKMRPRFFNQGKDAASVRYLGTSLLSSTEMVDFWNEIALTPQEAQVVATLQLIEPEVERVAVLGSGRRGTGVVLLMRDQEQRIPLGSMGEGMKRLFSLALSIGNMRAGGMLLIDEIDTGLHYSVMTSMWELVVRAAKTFDFQVFVTTHSLDCLVALAQFVEESASLASLVSVHRLEEGRTRAVRFDGAELKTAIAQELELR